MCHFLFVGIAQRHQPLLLEQLTKAGFEAQQSRNTPISAVFPVGDVVTTVTRGGCSCGVCGQASREFDEAAERRKYEKKGWSCAKIERAILGRRPSERPEFVAFRELFARVVLAVGSGRLLAHWVSGSVETEAVGALPSCRLALDEYLARSGACNDDVIYDVQSDELG